MAFLEEYDELASLPTKAAVAYMFLDLFKVHTREKRGLHYSNIAIASNISEENLQGFKTYLREKKNELRSGETKNCGKILWFFYHKLLEVDAFDFETRRDIISYMDICQYIIL
jgi:hypothetical protein